MPTTKRPTKKRKPRRTSAAVASEAGRLFNILQTRPTIVARMRRVSARFDGHELVELDITHLVDSVCGSALNQREHRGPRETKGRK